MDRCPCDIDKKAVGFITASFSALIKPRVSFVTVPAIIITSARLITPVVRWATCRPISPMSTMQMVIPPISIILRDLRSKNHQCPDQVTELAHWYESESAPWCYPSSCPRSGRSGSRISTRRAARQEPYVIFSIDYLLAPLRV